MAESLPDAELDLAREDYLPEDLPVDAQWDEAFDAPQLSGSGASRDDDDGNDFLLQRSAAPSLRDHLYWQLNLLPLGETDRAIATALIDAIDPDGYLSLDLKDFVAAQDDPDVGIEEVHAVLTLVQSLDPAGVGARNLAECLGIQLRQRPQDTPWRAEALRLLERHMDLLARQDFSAIKRRMRLDDQGIAQVMALIRSLDPKPGKGVASAPTEYVTPDVFVSRREGRWVVELNPEITPRLRVNADYAKLIRRADSSQDNLCLKDHLQEARWFIKSLMSRNETVLRVAVKIVEMQRGFFEYGEEAMQPLVLRDIADALEIHESTVSRVTTQKYMHTPRGTFEFKYFFSSHVSTSGGGECSSTAIRALIKKLIATETPSKPLSDHRLAELLKEQGIEVARRTVAKYRELMAIPPSSERKRLL